MKKTWLRMDPFWLLVIAAFGSLVITACATFKPENRDSWTGLSHVQKAAIMLSVWNTAYDQYVMEATNADMSDEAKDILRVKHDLIKESKPVLELYSTAALNGWIPEDKILAQAQVYFMRLMALIVSKKGK